MDFKMTALMAASSPLATTSPLPPRTHWIDEGYDSDCDATQKNTCIKDTLPTLLVANRGEGAKRISEIALELGLNVIQVFVPGDTSHLVDHPNVTKVQISDYTAMKEIVGLAQQHGAAIHPGWGFLSEKSEFAALCEASGVKLVGPSSDAMGALGSKDRAQRLAEKLGISVVPSFTPEPGQQITLKEAQAFFTQKGGPVVFKAVDGGGGRGQTVCHKYEDLAACLSQAAAVAETEFKNPNLMLQLFLPEVKHLEIQVLGDGKGDAWAVGPERDCSAQRRHQKVIEEALAKGKTDPGAKAEMKKAAELLAKAVGYEGAGTIEYLYDPKTKKFYFLEMNTRLQVEHTITELVTLKANGTHVNLVTEQLRIAAGLRPSFEGQELTARGAAIEVRVILEKPCLDTKGDPQFPASVGQCIQHFELPQHPNVTIHHALEDGQLTANFDPMVAKFLVWGDTRDKAVQIAREVLPQIRLSGVDSNLGYVLQIMDSKVYKEGDITTKSLETNPDFYRPRATQSPAATAASGVVSYVASLATGQFTISGADPKAEFPLEDPGDPPTIPREQHGQSLLQQWQTLGINGFTAWLLDEVARTGNPKIMLTDLRDAHQSLLATRGRTKDLLAMGTALNQLGVILEAWGGATFDAALQFLKESPWERLTAFSQAFPNSPISMLLRASNGVGYSAIPDNVLEEFTYLAAKNGVNIFRIFDANNDMRNITFSTQMVRKAQARLTEEGHPNATKILVEGAMTYVLDTHYYGVDYYMKLADDLVGMGCDFLCIKDMAGVLTPQMATDLVGAIRTKYPHIPLHLHVHDTSSEGAQVVEAAAKAGVTIVDLASDPLGGATSQPKVSDYQRAHNHGRTSANHTSLFPSPEIEAQWNQFVQQTFGQYTAFYDTSVEQFLGPQVRDHQIPGGQASNLLFQAKAILGESANLVGAIKAAYRMAEDLLSTGPRLSKVTPSSKAIGDFAIAILKYIGKRNITLEPYRELFNAILGGGNAEDIRALGIPDSVRDLLQGKMGEPPQYLKNGAPTDVFRPEIRTAVLTAYGLSRIEGRAGASLPPCNFDTLGKTFATRYGRQPSPEEVVTQAMFPKEMGDYMDFKELFGDLSSLSTRIFMGKMVPGVPYVETLSTGEQVQITLQNRAKDSDGNPQIHFSIRHREETAWGKEETWIHTFPKPIQLVQATNLACELGADLGKAKGAEITQYATRDVSGCQVPLTVGTILPPGALFAIVNIMKSPTDQTTPKDGKWRKVTSLTFADQLATGKKVPINHNALLITFEEVPAPVSA